MKIKYIDFVNNSYLNNEVINIILIHFVIDIVK